MLLAIGLSRALLLARQLLAGEDDDRDVAQARLGLHLLQQLEAGHVGQPQVDARSSRTARSRSASQRLGAGRRRR